MIVMAQEEERCVVAEYVKRAARRYRLLRPLVENQIQDVAGEVEHALRLPAVQCRASEITGMKVDGGCVYGRAREQHQGVLRGHTYAPEVINEREDKSIDVVNTHEGGLVVYRVVSHGQSFTVSRCAATGTRKPRHDEAVVMEKDLATASKRSPFSGRRSFKAATKHSHAPRARTFTVRCHMHKRRARRSMAA